MEEIRKQVSRARWRMILQQFLGIVTWSLFMGLAATVIAIAVPKIWVLPVDSQMWLWGWTGGALGIGLLFAAGYTYAVRRKPLEAAIEIDRRFGLKERVSSTLSLAPTELESEAGRALMDDAVRRVSRIDVREQFRLSGNWRALLPLVPAILLFVVAFLVPNAVPRKNASANEKAIATAEQMKKVSEELRKKIEQKKKEAEEKGLKEAEFEAIKKFQEGLEKLQAKDNLDKKNTLIKINELTKELEKRRDQLGGADEMKKQFEQMKNVERGPADKLAKAIKEGEFQKALEEMKKLQEDLAKGDLTQEQKEKLAEQLEQMKQKLEQAAAAHEQAKKDLEQQIKKKQQEGDKEGAAKMQQQLDKMNQKNQRLDKMQEMASKLGQCSKCLKEGDGDGAKAQLDQIGKELKEMQKEMEEMKAIDDVMNEVAQAKNAIGKDGDGDQMNGDQFNPDGDGDMRNGGNGLGPGDRGYGARPYQEVDTANYDSQVRGKPKKGEAVRAGDADGPNVAGATKEEVKQAILSSVSKDSDALLDDKLPRAERDHAREYFKRVRGGK
jgi:chemotaxis protein histidine kinase CheA